MQARFFLPLLWLLNMLMPVPRLRAQGQPLGPWQIVNKKVRTSDNDDAWGSSNRDTATYLGTKTWLLPVCWDVVPDSIRLFLNCENPLIAPPRPRNGQLPIRFSASGATVRLDAKSRRLFIAPTTTTVTLWAHRGRVLLFKHEFKAIPPPLPHVVFLVDGVYASDGRYSHNRGGYGVDARIEPEPTFYQFIPDEAKYRVLSFQVTLLRNGIPLESTVTVSGAHLSVDRPFDYLQPEDQLQIDVQQVQRQNFRGEVETMPLSQRIIVRVR